MTLVRKGSQPSMLSRRVLRLAACVAGVLGLGLGALGVLAIYEGSPHALLKRKGDLVKTELTPVGDDAVSTFWKLTLRSSTDLTVRALLRLPRSAEGPSSAAVLIGGIKRGRRVVTVQGLESLARHAVLVSPDYPLHLGRDAWNGVTAIPTALRLRAGAFDSVAHVLLLLDYLESRPDVDRRRLLLIGGSLGAELVTIAGGVDTRPAAVIALYGGGRLGQLVGHTLAHPTRARPLPPWLASLGGHALAWLLTPLDPERYAPAIAPRPFLMVNGSGDSLVPRANVMALYAAAQSPKDLILVESDHVQPSETELLRDLSRIVLAWLDRHGILPGTSSWLTDARRECATR